ncbi:cytosolic carboxypeptidase-like protein 5 [Hetaerina americana]|uniref:cytosolic carboxypeptidase-like protein 5 n=1 Tax=Hetaerina americana TaxID=62018 RepID=UPI003A7F3A38
MEVTISGISFSSRFDSGNLARVEPVLPQKRGKSQNEPMELEFNLWTRNDAADTEFRNSYSSWFHFSVKGIKQPVLMKFNIVNMNRHSRVFTDHMYPVYMIHGHQRWQRIKEKPCFTDSGENAVLTFSHRIENLQKVYFALCYPYPYRDITAFLKKIDAKYSSVNKSNFSSDDIYYYRECVCNSLDGRNVDLITITSTWGISKERECRLKNLFPNTSIPRPHQFPNKQVIFISARVHPAETSSSFVLDGIITSLLNKEDPGAALLRRKFLFKLIPVLNPDGVVRGHYRTDTRGTNLNRVYGNPSFEMHPPIYAACALIRYYHRGNEAVDDLASEENGGPPNEETEILVDGAVSCPEEDKGAVPKRDLGACAKEDTPRLFFYLDLHSHASRRGFFLYGNNFPKIEDCVEARVFGKLMEINCRGFVFNSCDFSEASMHLKDKSGTGSREGAGRVWVMNETGLVYSYTFEAHYNTGQVETCIPRKTFRLESKNWISYIPSEYSPPTYEGVGRAILQSILDLTGPNAWSRVASSSVKSLAKLRESILKELSAKTSQKKSLPFILKTSTRMKTVTTFRSLSGTTAKKKVAESRPSTQQTLKHGSELKKKVKDLTKDSRARKSTHPKFMPRVECRRAAIAPSANKEIGGAKKKVTKKTVEETAQRLDAVVRLSEPDKDNGNAEDNPCCPPS